jgi:hypothetical protein
MAAALATSSACSDENPDALMTHRSAEPVLDALGCDRSVHVESPGEPVPPNSARECVRGEDHLTVRTYDSLDDRDRALEYLHQYSGSRVVGDAWIIAVDTPEVAQMVADKTSGTVVELRGTAPN